MPALIVVSNSEHMDKLSEFYDDYEVLQLSSESEKYYDEANKTVYLAKSYNPIILIVGHPTLTAIVASKLARVRNFFIAEWTGNRFKMLKIP